LGYFCTLNSSPNIKSATKLSEKNSVWKLSDPAPEAYERKVFEDFFRGVWFFRRWCELKRSEETENKIKKATNKD